MTLHKKPKKLFLTAFFLASALSLSACENKASGSSETAPSSSSSATSPSASNNPSPAKPDAPMPKNFVEAIYDVRSLPSDKGVWVNIKGRLANEAGSWQFLFSGGEAGKAARVLQKPAYFHNGKVEAICEDAACREMTLTLGQDGLEAELQILRLESSELNFNLVANGVLSSNSILRSFVDNYNRSIARYFVAHKSTLNGRTLNLQIDYQLASPSGQLSTGDLTASLLGPHVNFMDFNAEHTSFGVDFSTGESITMKASQ